MTVCEGSGQGTHRDQRLIECPVCGQELRVGRTHTIPDHEAPARPEQPAWQRVKWGYRFRTCPAISIMKEADVYYVLAAVDLSSTLNDAMERGEAIYEMYFARGSHTIPAASSPTVQERQW
jgi:hypothetical protein